MLKQLVQQIEQEEILSKLLNQLVTPEQQKLQKVFSHLHPMEQKKLLSLLEGMDLLQREKLLGNVIDMIQRLEQVYSYATTGCIEYYYSY